MVADRGFQETVAADQAEAAAQKSFRRIAQVTLRLRCQLLLARAAQAAASARMAHLAATHRLALWYMRMGAAQVGISPVAVEAAAAGLLLRAPLPPQGVHEFDLATVPELLKRCLQ